MVQDKELIELVMEEFKGFAKHPRPSHHEKAISDYLVNRLQALGVTEVVQDEAYNIIAEVPAATGYEKAPLTILQGHMDMVCVAKPGYPFDPLTSEIKLIREGNILRADRTSLGADDGAGLASILILLKLGVDHGPLRIIFTTDEETGMTGAARLNPKYICDAQNIINCDSENLDVICTGSAGSCHTHFTRHIQWENTIHDYAVCIKTHEFIGGHSGETISHGKSNAIQALAETLLAIRKKGIDYRLAAIDGGDAANAIPANSSAVVVCNKKDIDAINSTITSVKEAFYRIYKGIEDKAKWDVEEVAVPVHTFSLKDTEMLINLLCILHCGTFVMNQSLPRLPELSSNIGTIKTTDDIVTFEYFPRAGADDRLSNLLQKLPLFAELTGFSYEQGKQEPAWTVNAVSRLAPLYEKAFEKVTGRKVRKEAVHGGLETGHFYHLNSSADIISIGPNTHDIHSADESVELDSIATMIRVLAETLANIR